MDTKPNKSIEENQSFDIKKFILKILAYWYLFIISLGLAWVFAYVQNQFETPIYSVHSTVLVRQETRSTENLLGGLQLFNPAKNLQNEIGIFESYSLARATIEELDFTVSYFKETRFRDIELYKKSPFVINIDTTHKQWNYKHIGLIFLDENYVEITQGNDKNGEKTKVRIGDYFENESFRFKIDLRNSYHPSFANETYYFYFNTPEALTNQYKGKTKIQPRFTSGSMLWLWISGPVAEKETNYLNKLVEVYIAQAMEEKTQKATKTIEFIDKQIEGIMDSLLIAENELQNFRKLNDIVDINRESENLFNRLDELHEQKFKLRTQLKYYKYFLEDFNNNLAENNLIYPTLLGIEDAILQAQIQKLVALYEDKAKLELSVIKDIPSLKLLESAIKNTKLSIQSNVEKSITSTNLQLTEIQTDLEVIYQKLHEIPITERHMETIKRKFNLNDKNYTFLLQRRMEAGITQATTEADAKVLDKADSQRAVKQSPNPTSKRNKALVIGLIIPLLYVILKDFFNNKIMDKSDIESITKIPIIASIGHNDKNTQLPAYTYPKSPVSESFRSLRTNLQYLIIDKEQRLISFTSTVSGEGKTFVAANLSAIIAASDKKTLLIGLDLRKPRLHSVFEMRNNIGISTYLIGENTLEEIILPTEVPSLDLALSGPIPPNPAELLESPKMYQFLEWAKNNYEYVILDTPPLAFVSDSLLLSNFCDVNIYVVRQNYTNKNALKMIDELYVNKNVSHLSILVNDVTFSSHYGYKYGYGHGYGYSYGYGTNYGKGYYDDEKTAKNILNRIKQRLGF